MKLSTRIAKLTDSLIGTKWHPLALWVERAYLRRVLHKYRLAVWLETKIYRITTRPPCGTCRSWAGHDAIVAANKNVVAELKNRWGLDDVDINEFHKLSK